MRGKKLTMLYVFVLALVIIVIAPGCTSLETYELRCRDLSDDELIAEFYRVDVELQEALEEYERDLEEAQQQEGIATLTATVTKLRVKKLRRQKGIVLTIIHQRGLALPVSVE